MKSRDGKRRRKKIKKRKSPKKEDPGARKGRKVAKHYVFPMICGSGGSKSRLAKAAGFEVKMYKTRHVRTTFGSWDVEKSARRCGAKHISKSKVQKTVGYGALLDVQMSFHVAGARDCAPCQKWAKRESFVAFPKRGRCSTLHRWSGKSQNALVRGRQLCTQLSIFEGCLAEWFRFWRCKLLKLRKSRRIVSFLMLSSSKIEEGSSTLFFVFDVVKFKNWGSLA